MFFPLPCEWGLPAILCCYLWHSEKMARNLVCRVMSIATPKIRLTGLRCWLMLVGWLAGLRGGRFRFATGQADGAMYDWEQFLNYADRHLRAPRAEKGR
jgi:hypothetical protein